MATVKLSRNDKPRSSDAHIVYDLPGGGQVYIPSSRVSGEAPETITIGGLSLTDGLARGGRKLTDEEKAARAEARKNETPAQKAERARILAERAAKRAAELAAAAGVSA